MAETEGKMSKFWDTLQKIKNHQHFTFDDIKHIYNGNATRAIDWIQEALTTGRVERKLNGYKYNA